MRDVTAVGSPCVAWQSAASLAVAPRKPTRAASVVTYDGGPCPTRPLRTLLAKFHAHFVEFQGIATKIDHLIAKDRLQHQSEEAADVLAKYSWGYLA